MLRKHQWGALAMLLSSVSLGFYVFSEIAFDEVFAHVQEIGITVIWWLALILTLMTLCHVLRWILMCRALVPNFGKGTLVYNLFLGIFLNQTLPVGGDAVRMAHLVIHKMSLSQALICLLFDRVLALFALFFIAFVTLFLQYVASSTSELAKVLEPFVLLIATTLICLTFVGILLISLRHKLLKFFDSYSNFAAVFFVKLINSLNVLIQNPVQTLLCLLLAIGVQFFVCSIALAIVLVAGWHLEPFALFSMVAFVLILAYLPISLAGWGVRETGFILIAPYVGILEAQALVIAIILGTSQLIQGLICGGLILLPSVKNFRK